MTEWSTPLRDTLASILQMADNLLPAKFILHSGACDEDVLNAYCGLQPDKVQIISEDSKQFDRFNSHHAVPVTFELIPGLVAAQEGEHAYYRASIERESGLLEQSELRSLWANISILEETKIQTTSLERILHAGTIAPNWLVLNQLGSAGILDQSILNELNLDVLVVRCVDDEFHHGDLESSKAGAIDAIMINHGFRLFTSLAERHPRSHKRFYLRDWKSTLNTQLEIARKSEALAESRLLNLQLETESLRQENDALTHSLDVERQQMEQTKRRLENLSRESSDLGDLVRAIQSEKDEVMQQAKNAEERLCSEKDLVKQTKLKQAKLESRAESAEKKLALAKNDLKDLQSKYKSLTARADEMQKIITQTRGHLTSMRTSLGSSIRPKRTKPKASQAAETNGSE